MAKYIKNIITQVIIRTTDEKAQEKIKSHKYIYCTKTEIRKEIEIEKSIKEVLIRKYGITEKEAESEIGTMRVNLNNELKTGKRHFKICKNWFGSKEENYIEELLF